MNALISYRLSIVKYQLQFSCKIHSRMFLPVSAFSWERARREWKPWRATESRWWNPSTRHPPTAGHPALCRFHLKTKRHYEASARKKNNAGRRSQGFIMITSSLASACGSAFTCRRKYVENTGDVYTPKIIMSFINGTMKLIPGKNALDLKPH